MRFLALLGCIASTGLCQAHTCDSGKWHHRGSGKSHHMCENTKLHKKGKFGRFFSSVDQGSSVVGFATFPCSNQPILIKEGDTLAPPFAIVRNLGFSNGEFTIGSEGTYSVGYLAKMLATNAVAGNSVTMGVVVNGQVVKTDEIFSGPCVKDDLPSTFPFFGHKKFQIPLQVGDKVSLKVVAVSLPEGSSLSLAERFGKGKCAKKPIATIFLNLVESEAGAAGPTGP